MVEEIIAQRKRGIKLKEKIAKSKNSTLIEAMSSLFDEAGIYQLTSDQIHSHLLNIMPKEEVPTSMIIRKVMKETF